MRIKSVRLERTPWMHRLKAPSTVKMQTQRENWETMLYSQQNLLFCRQWQPEIHVYIWIKCGSEKMEHLVVKWVSRIKRPNVAGELIPHGHNMIGEANIHDFVLHIWLKLTTRDRTRKVCCCNRFGCYKHDK